MKQIQTALQSLWKLTSFDENVDTNSTSDTGAESIRLANRSVKTTKRTVKTTANTVKTTGKVVRDTGKAVYQATKTVVKVTVSVFKVAAAFWEHAIAAMLNPVIWIITLLAFMVILYGAALVVVISGNMTNTEAAYVSAAGLRIVKDEFRHGQELFHAAETAKHSDFRHMIRSAQYSDTRSACDLIYMEKTYPNGTGSRDKSVFEVGFASDYYKEIMENAWHTGINETEVLAVAYIRLQKQINDSRHTQMQIYDVKYTPEVFAEILELCVRYSDTKTENVECPGADCDSYKEWYWDDDEEDWDYDYVDFCPHLHTLHCFGLAFFDKNDVMSALGFTQKEKEWEEMTEKYFGTITP
jgi:hypothetical protein